MIMPLNRARPLAGSSECTRQSHMRMKPGSRPPGSSSAARSCVPISHSRSMPIQLRSAGEGEKGAVGSGEEGAGERTRQPTACNQAQRSAGARHTERQEAW